MHFTSNPRVRVGLPRLAFKILIQTAVALTVSSYF